MTSNNIDTGTFQYVHKHAKRACHHKPPVFYGPHTYVKWHGLSRQVLALYNRECFQLRYRILCELSGQWWQLLLTRSICHSILLSETLADWSPVQQGQHCLAFWIFVQDTAWLACCCHLVGKNNTNEIIVVGTSILQPFILRPPLIIIRPLP